MLKTLIKEVTSGDQAFITEMLYQAIHVKEGEAPPPRSILKEAKLIKYYAIIGLDTDIGYIAIDEESGAEIGAIWLRVFSKDNPGWGYLADNIPELSIAVLPNYRGRGVGSLLIKHLLEQTIELYPKISLSVDADNKALQLYKQHGFIEIKEVEGSITMLLDRENK